MKITSRSIVLLFNLIVAVSVANADKTTEEAWRALRRRLQEKNSTIVGGQQQTEREPWMVRFSNGACGASLISEDLGSSLVSFNHFPFS